MGHNVDLEFMIGAPHELKCPRCKHKQRTFFNDYDIDCGDPNPEPGVWVLSVYCDNCEFDWQHRGTAKLKKTRK